MIILGEINQVQLTAGDTARYHMASFTVEIQSTNNLNSNISGRWQERERERLWRRGSDLGKMAEGGQNHQRALHMNQFLTQVQLLCITSSIKRTLSEVKKPWTA